jgi:D-glycero-D-manno-heptose 1,7-bisphosphate phosphatase
MLQAILLDRDGVINRERADYVKCWDELELLPGAVSALRRLAALPIPICVLTNQSAIGRGIVTAQTVAELHRRLADAIAAQGGRIDAFFVCPHRPDEACGCRKSQPGLLLQAAHQFGLDLARCVMVGDSISDYAAATAAGCPAILVRTGQQGPELARRLPADVAVPILPDLAAAAEEVLHRYDYKYQTG